MPCFHLLRRLPARQGGHGTICGLPLLAAASLLGLSTVLAGQGLSPLTSAPPLPPSGVMQIYGAPGQADPLGPGDLLDLRVFGEEQMSGEVRVAADGMIDPPFLGSVQAAGKTPAELERQLTSDYGRLLQHPLVSLRVMEVNSRHVAVTGEVPRPGLYAYSGQVRLMDALVMAGGLDPTRASQTVLLVHQPPPVATASANGTPLFVVNSSLETIDLSRLAEQPELNRTLRPGDVIEVAAADQVFVTGQTRETGAEALRPALTLSEAVSAAGGLIGTADAHHVQLLRQLPNSTQRQQMTFDLTAIEHHRAADPGLEANDIIVVPGSVLRYTGLEVLDFFSGSTRWRLQQTVLSHLH